MRKNFLRLLLLLTVLVAGLYMALIWYFSDQILFPYRAAPDYQSEWIQQSRTVEDQHFPIPEEFEVKGQEEVAIRGWYFAHPETAGCLLVAAHGWGGTRSEILKWADIFWDCGCDVVVYDHRGHGESGGEHGTGGIMEKADLMAVTDWAQKKTGLSDEETGWAGISWGAATMLQAGVDREVAFIMADSPFQDWETAIMERAERMYGGWVGFIKGSVMSLAGWRAGVDYREASAIAVAPRIKSPVFLIHSRTDEATASFQSVNLDSALNPDRHVFFHTDWGAGHVEDIDVNPDLYRYHVYSFLKSFAPNWGACSPTISRFSAEIQE